jgi:hypothetical protein
MRGFLADYGAPLMVVVWTGLSFALQGVAGVPRRVETPNTWQVRGCTCTHATKVVGEEGGLAVGVRWVQVSKKEQGFTEVPCVQFVFKVPAQLELRMTQAR